MTKIILEVDTDNPINTAEGTFYFIPALHDCISEHQLSKYAYTENEKGAAEELRGLLDFYAMEKNIIVR